MRRTRYLAAISADGRLPREIGERLRSLGQFKKVFERAPVSLFASGEEVGSLDRCGMLVGSLFSKSATGPAILADLDGADTEAIAKQLIDHFWGGYVAFLAPPEGSSVSVVRAPLGDLPCHCWSSEKLQLLGSDIAVLRAAGMPAPSIDVSALARHIAAEDLRCQETCLEGVSELQGGERLIVSGARSRREILWSPWQFIRPSSDSLDPVRSTLILHETAMKAIACQAERFRHVLLKLSGGLDSSIVAACLAASGTDFACLNLVTRHPAGDEREQARSVARHLGVPLIERYREVAGVDVERSSAARLPRPTSRAFTQESARNALEVAGASNADAIFDGGGGDNIFCSLQSVRPLADCLGSRAGRPHAAATARSIAELAQVSLWPVIRRALGIVARRSNSYPWTVDTRFLSSEAARLAEDAGHHPWLDTEHDAPPGKAAHVALIAAAQSVVEGFDAEDELPSFSPLICQPLVEACLAIPSWLWFERGRNRAAARRAFAGELPEAILWRRSKGAPDCFIADLYDSNREKIREMLLDGVLTRERLIDRDSVDSMLDNEAPVTGHDWLRIMHLVDAEAWARCWS